ncbi:MAG: ATP-binding protein [Clostridia bacterium]|nr:ATP-binding protein [Clostridia bacterium]
MTNYIKRDMEALVASVSERYSGMLLTGPRQVGKSTMLRHIMGEEREVVTLDNYAERALAKNDPARFLSVHALPLLVDEVQYAPELFSYVKMAIDEGAPPGSFWLTGSQSMRLMRLAGESMAGRVALLSMSGLSQNEIYGCAPNVPFSLGDRDGVAERVKSRKRADTDEIFKRIFDGSLPGYIRDGAEDRDIFYTGYTGLYLDRDVREEIPGVSPERFFDFVCAAACRIGQTLNVHSLASDVGVSDDTARRWLEVLEKSGIIFYLTPYSNNLLARTVKQKKMYFFDTGVASFLTNQSSPKIMEGSTFAGAALENYVVSEIRKTYVNSGKVCHMYYYRDVQNREIDLVLEDGGMLHPIEIKKNTVPAPSMISNFSVLRKSSVPTGLGAVVCMSDSLSALDGDTLVIPVWAI